MPCNGPATGKLSLSRLVIPSRPAVLMCTVLGSMPRSGHGTTPPLPLAASTRLRACWPIPAYLPGKNVNVMDNATVVLPVSNEELPFPLLIFRLLQPDDPTSASPADLNLGNLANLANLAPIHLHLSVKKLVGQTSMPRPAAATLRLLFAVALKQTGATTPQKKHVLSVPYSRIGFM